MAEKSKKHWLSIINKVMTLPLILSLLSNLFHVMVDEISIAKKNLVLIIMVSLIALILIASTWLSLLGLFYLYLLSFGFTLIQSLVVIFILNLLLLILVTIWLNTRAKSLFLPKTQRIIHHLLGQ